MPPEVAHEVFTYLDEFGPCCIFGSAVWRYESAADIDVMFPASADFKSICRELGVTYSGWQRGDEHLRNTRGPLSVPGVDKPVHLTQSDHIEDFYDFPFSCLLPSGLETKPGIYLTIRKPDRDWHYTYRPGGIGTSTYPL